jgi:hypothetical protein
MSTSLRIFQSSTATPIVSSFAILDSGGDHTITVDTVSNETANRNLIIPLLGGDKVLVVGDSTLTASRIPRVIADGKIANGSMTDDGAGTITGPTNTTLSFRSGVNSFGIPFQLTFGGADAASPNGADGADAIFFGGAGRVNGSGGNFKIQFGAKAGSGNDGGCIFLDSGGEELLSVNGSIASIAANIKSQTNMFLIAQPSTDEVGASKVGRNISITASNAFASTDTASAAAGGNLTLTTGNAARFTSGDANGGNLQLTFGTGIGTGTRGQLLINDAVTPDTSNDVIIAASSSTRTPLLITGAAGQSANVLEYRQSDGTLKFQLGDLGFLDATRLSLLGTGAFINSPGSGQMDFTEGGSGQVQLNLSANLLRIQSDAQYAWSSSATAAGSAVDTGLGRDSAAIVKTTDGSTGMGSLLTKRVIEANTAGSGSPNILLVTESNKLLTNEGTTAENYHTLPSAAAGIEYVFACQDGDGIRITANTGDTIRLDGLVSASAGFIRSSVIGSAVILTAINVTEWVAISVVGTWSIDT